MIKHIFYISLLFPISLGVFATDCDYESIIFSHLAKQYKSTNDCFLIDPRDVEVNKEGVASIIVKERHNEKCGGDLNTLPSAGFFHINLESCEIKRLDMTEGIYENIQK